MHMGARLAAVTGTAALVAAAGMAPGWAARPSTRAPASSSAGRHVLLLSVDGMHQSDLAWYVQTHPHSALAALASRGTEYTAARTPVPADSFPGLLAQVTGGNPATTGIYYDDTYNTRLLPAGTTDCAGVAAGAAVTYDESADRNSDRLDAGQGLPNLPRDILAMTKNPRTVLNPAALPVNPVTCKPIYPHSYLKVNTIFEVARAHGLRTAWSDKHPVYEIVNGPSGTGVQDLFTPEIDSLAPGYDGNWAQDNFATRQYDHYKVKAVLNQIDGLDHSGTTRLGMPAVFGMNFQSVSTAQKLPTSDGLTGGYRPDGTPGPLLRGALNFVNASVSSIRAELYAQHRSANTTIVLSAKHGQSPINPAALTRIDDGAIIDALDTAWASNHPNAAPLIAAATNDNVLQLWFSDRSPAAAHFAKAWLLSHPATGNTITGKARTLPSSGLLRVYAGKQVSAFFHAAPYDPRRPDIYGLARHGVVYTGKTTKIAEHGGADADNRDVPLLIAGPGIKRGATNHTRVETTQIAPTILRLLGLNPRELEAVRVENTKVLPDL